MDPPMIDNPEYKGEWKPRQIDNPAYKGPWIHPEIDNPEYNADDAKEIAKFDEICKLGFDLWQVKAGTIFDNVLITDDKDHAKKVGEELWSVTKDAEKKMKDEQDEEEKKKAEEEAKSSPDEEDEDDEDLDDENEEDMEALDESEEAEAEDGHDEL
jgi:calreticulin